jgi:hypothetical protein
MTSAKIETDFRNRIGEKIHLRAEGQDRFRVFTPFRFEDGDHLSIVLKKEQNKWFLSDEGHTLMHLSYDIDLKDIEKGNRKKLISSALSTYNVALNDGQLISTVVDEHYGDALFNFVQGLVRISDVSYLNRERIRSTFLEDFRAFASQKIPEGRRVFDWHDKKNDPDGKYTVDCKVNSMAKPLFLFAVPTDDRCNIDTITIFHYKNQGLKFRSLGIFAEQEEINRKALARFSDVVDKQFSTLKGNEEQIESYLKECMQSA